MLLSLALLTLKTGTLMTMELPYCSVVDMFCGAGGLTHGFVKEGFRVLVGIDCDPQCEYPYTENNPSEFKKKRIEDITVSELRSYFPHNHKKILVGCAPCQPFSSYTKQFRETTTKWQLVETFIDLAIQAKPYIISMENVPESLTFRQGTVFNGLVHNLTNAGYYVSHYKVYCPDYGIPQMRTRLVIFASRYAPISLIKPTHSPENYLSVKDVIGHLPPIAAGQVHPADALHRSSGLTEKNKKRIQQSLPGGTWKDWDESLIADCHKKETGASYNAVYGRMRWETPSPTITTECNGYGNGRFGHPEQDRAISMREAAIFQTFPNEYKFFPPGSQWSIEPVARLIGNAVPVKLGQVIAKSIKQHLRSTR